MKDIKCICGYAAKNKYAMANHKRHCDKAIDRLEKLTILYSSVERGEMKRDKRVQYENLRKKTNGISYSSLHIWIRSLLGIANKCEKCGKTEMPKNRKNYFQWANISGKYKKDLSDWMQMCASCHSVHDGLAKLSKKNVLGIRKKYNNGESPKLLALEYGVSQSTIFRVVRNQIPAYDF